MTTRERVREQGFAYDSDLPPSVPAGEPLRLGAKRGARAPRAGLYRSCARALSSLRAGQRGA